MYDENHPLQNNFLILDEASMNVISLAFAFLHELLKETNILWVGDTDQHSLFGEGNVLHDYILLPCYIHITLVKSKAVPL